MVKDSVYEFVGVVVAICFCQNDRFIDDDSPVVDVQVKFGNCFKQYRLFYQIETVKSPISSI